MPLVREDTAVEDTVPQTVSAVVAPSSIVKQLYPDNEPPPLTELAVKVKEVAEEVRVKLEMFQTRRWRTEAKLQV